MKTIPPVCAYKLNHLDTIFISIKLVRSQNPFNQLYNLWFDDFSFEF